MLTQPLLEKPIRLRLPAFRAALKEQLHNLQYAGLPFEDRLCLLIDRECTHRDNNRLARNLKAARLPLPATIEDLDLSPSRGLDRRLVLQLAEGGWVRPTSQHPVWSHRSRKTVSGLRACPRCPPS